MTDLKIYEDLCKLQEKAAIDLNNARNDYDTAPYNLRTYFAAIFDLKLDVYNLICKKNNAFFQNFIETEIV